MFFAGVCTYANAPQPGPVSSSSSAIKSNNIISPKKSIGVRIASPVFGDHILINGKNYFNKNGEKLLIRGTSVFNSDLTGCSVSIIANGVKPYQITNGTGPKGKTDYSSWIYGFTPSYSPLKVGSNKITAKLSCEPKNLLAYYSVNVTGAISTSIPTPKAAVPATVKPTVSANTLKAAVPATVKSIKNNSVNTNTPPLVRNSSIPSNQSILQPPPYLQPSPHFNSNTALSPLYITTPNSSSVIQTPASTPPVVSANNATSFASTSHPSALASSTSNNTGNPYLSAQPQVTPPSPQTPPSPPILQANNATSPFSAPPAIQSASPQTPPSPPIVQANNATSPSPAVSATSTNNSTHIAEQSNSTTENPKSMNIVIDTKGDGKNRAIVVVTRDLLSDKPLKGVSLNGSINDHTFSGITNSKGEYNKGISSLLHKPENTINVQVTASEDGYKTDNANATFTISSISHTSPDNTSPDNTSPDNTSPDNTSPDNTSPDNTSPDNTHSHSHSEFKTKIKSNAQDLASKIARDVQSQLSKQGINIPLPFG
jgi:hypothetical protein